MKIFFSSVLLGILSAVASADVAALSFANPGEYTQDSYVLGWYFEARQAARVTALGFYDDLDATDSDHPVGLYDIAADAFLATATVLTSDAKTGAFRYHGLATPVDLVAGRRYALVGVTFNDKYNSFATGTAVDPRLTYLGGAIDYTGDATQLSKPLQYFPNAGGS